MIVLYDVILLQFDVIRWYRRIKLQRVVRWRDSLMSCIDVIVRWRDWALSFIDVILHIVASCVIRAGASKLRCIGTRVFFLEYNSVAVILLRLMMVMSNYSTHNLLHIKSGCFLTELCCKINDECCIFCNFYSTSDEVLHRNG